MNTIHKIYTTTQLPVAFCYPNEFFSVKDTLECGQVFRYYDLGDGYYGVFSGSHYAQLHEEGNQVVVQTHDKDYFFNYFALDVDYGELVKNISAISPFMREVANFGKGIRILRQDSFETLFSFIISSNNNIKRIQQIVERLCEGAGQQTPFGYAFPTSEDFDCVADEFFSTLGVGYRDKFLLYAARNANKDALEKLKTPTPTSTARQQLQSFLGVGPKVADCVLLFGLEHGDVFPVDTWMKKVYHEYFETGLPDGAISEHFCNLFGENAGLCQQYLFYFQRN